jgi:hypothetical protein
MKGFKMSLDVMEKFFQRVCQLKEDTPQARLAIMSELIHEHDIKILKEDQIVEELKGKKVMAVDPKRTKKNV